MLDVILWGYCAVVVLFDNVFDLQSVYFLFLEKFLLIDGILFRSELLGCGNGEELQEEDECVFA